MTDQDPAIWSRTFRLYFTARSSGLLGDSMLQVAVAAGLISSGHSASTVGFALAWWLGPFAGLILFGGVLADLPPCPPAGRRGPPPPAG